MVTTGTPIHSASQVVVPDAGQAVERDVGAQVTGEICRDRSLADLLDALARDALTSEESQHPCALAVVRRCQQYQA
jgi:hypothetical protein